MDGKLNSKNKAAFSNFPSVMKTGRNLKCQGIKHISIDGRGMLKKA